MTEKRRRGPPGLSFSFPLTRYYYRQLMVNPNRAMKTFLHTILPFAFKHPKRKRQRKKNIEKPKETYSFKYTKKKKLSEGGFSKVFKANCVLLDKSGKKYKEICALKVIALKTSESESSNVILTIEDAENEVKALIAVQDNEYMVEYKTHILKKDELTIVTELCSYPDLASILARAKFLNKHNYSAKNIKGKVASRMSCSTVKFIIAPIFDGLRHMHKVGYLHKDIKPQNILINSEGIPKLCDFGLAQEKPKENELLDGKKRVGGTFYYQAPESVARKDFNETIDTWQIGMSMLTLVFGYNPYEFRNECYWDKPKLKGEEQDYRHCVTMFIRASYHSDSINKEEKLFNILLWQRLNLNKELNIEENKEEWYSFISFMKEIMTFNVRKRMTCTEITQHEYIAKPLTEWKNRSLEDSDFNTNFQQWKTILKSI